MNWFALVLELLPLLPRMIAGIEADIEALKQHPDIGDKMQDAVAAVNEVTTVLNKIAPAIKQ